jgi:hypothetical protein
MATSAARSRLRITTHSNVELKCYVPLAESEEVEEAKEFYGKLP